MSFLVDNGSDDNGLNISEQDELMYHRFVSESSSQLIIAFVKNSGKIARAWVGSEAAKILGYEVSEIEANPMLLFEAIHPEDRERMVSNFVRFHLEIPCFEEYRILHKDGRVQWIRESCVIVYRSPDNTGNIAACTINLVHEKSNDEILSQFKQIFDEAQNAVAMRDLNGKLIYCNEAMAKLYGYGSVDEMRNVLLEDLIVLPELKKECRENIVPHILSGPWTGELALRRSDGSRIDISASTSLIRYSDGRPSAVCIIMMDITERKQIEQAAYENLELLNSTLNSLSAHIAMIDKNGIIVSTNNAWNTFGRENGDSQLTHTGTGQNYLDVCRRARGQHSKDAKEALAGIQDVLNGKRADFEMEYSCHSPAEKRWYIMRVIPIAGKHVGAVISHINITKRKNMEETLTKFKSAVDATNNAITLIDPDWCVFYINPAKYDLMGYTLEDYRSRGISVSYADPRVFENEIKPVVNAGKSWRSEVELIHKNGGHLIVDNEVIPVFDDGGAFIAIMSIFSDITQHKEDEKQLLTMGLALDCATDGIGISDAAGHPFYINSALEKMFGYSLQEYAYLGTDLMFIDAMKFKKEILPRMLAGENWRGEIEMRRKDSTRIFVDVNAVPVTNKNNELIGLMGVFNDITERKQAEESIIAGERVLRQFVEHTPAAVAMYDKNLRYIVYSKRWLTDFKLGNRDITGLSFYDVFPKISERWRQNHKNALNGAVLKSDEDVFEREDGTFDWLKWEIRPWTDAEGKIGGIIVFAEVITDRKKAEKALRQAEEKFRNLVDNVEAIIYRIDKNLNVVALAGQIEKISGYKNTEILSKPSIWRQMMHPDEIKAIKQRHIKMAKTGESTRAEVRIIDKDGELHWVQAHETPRFDENGDILYFDGIGVDVTERVLARQREAIYTARMASLAEMSQKFASSLDFDEIVRIATDSIFELIECSCGIMAVSQKALKTRYCSISCVDPLLSERVEGIKDEVFNTIESALAKTGARMFIESDFVGGSAKVVEIEDIAGIGPGIVVPIYAGNELICMLSAVRSESNSSFDEQDMWFLEEVAAHASSAMTNAILYKRQSRIAETLQRSFIPSSPKVEALDIATRYVPAPGEAEVGGDFFDIIDFQNGKYGLVVGDVSGKGIEAAVHTAEAKYMLRGLALQNPRPEFVMHALNRSLYKSINAFTFVTMVYVLIEPGIHQLTYVNAGHEPAIVLCRRTQTVKELYPTGKVLGVVPDEVYQSKTALLEPDDLLVCYTDGITELPIDNVRLGYKKLLYLVSLAQSNTSSELLNYIMGSINNLGQAKQADDQVIVVARPYV